MLPIGSVLVDTLGWRGKFTIDLARYYALGNEQREAATEARNKYASDKEYAGQSYNRAEYLASRRRKQAAELLKRRGSA